MEIDRPSKVEIQRSLRFSNWDGIFASIMLGFGESYLGVFAISLKASNPQIALIASLPQLLGALFQLVSVRILNLFRNRRMIILTGVIGQATSWLLIIFIPFLFSNALSWLIGAVIAYFVLGGFANPAWNSLMGDLVDSNKRGRYFGMRSRLMSIAAFTSLCLGGVILDRTEKRGMVGLGFVALFLIALSARFVSAYYLSKMTYPGYIHRAEDHFSIWQFLRDGRQTNFGRFVLYTGLTHFAVHVSGPFIAPYLLRDLHFTYFQFMLASAATVLAQFLTLHIWGRFGDQFGNKKVLALSGLLLPLIPLCWLFTTHLYTILLIQMIAGVGWAGFSLAMGNFVFDIVSPPKRAQCIAVYNLSNAMGIFLGASLGGLLSGWLPREIQLGTFHLSLISNLQILFFLSALLRLVVWLKFLPMIREAREVRPFGPKDLFIGVTQMRPLSGLKFNFFSLRTSRKKVRHKEEGLSERERPMTVGDRGE